MRRTWLVRGAVAAVLAVLVTAWALGIAGVGGSASPKEEADGPAPTDRSSESDVEPSAVVGSTGTTPSPDAKSPSEEPEVEPSSEAAEEAEPSAVPAKSGIKPTRKPSSSQKPSPTPSPTEPTQGCTDVVSVTNCILAPITSQP